MTSLCPSSHKNCPIDTFSLARCCGDLVGAGRVCWSQDNQVALLGTDVLTVLYPENLVNRTTTNNTRGIFSSVTSLKRTSLTQVRPTWAQHQHVAHDDPRLLLGVNSCQPISSLPQAVTDSLITAIGTPLIQFQVDDYLSTVFGSYQRSNKEMPRRPIGRFPPRVLNRLSSRPPCSLQPVPAVGRGRKRQSDFLVSPPSRHRLTTNPHILEPVVVLSEGENIVSGPVGEDVNTVVTTGTTQRLKARQKRKRDDSVRDMNCPEEYESLGFKAKRVAAMRVQHLWRGDDLSDSDAQDHSLIKRRRETTEQSSRSNRGTRKDRNQRKKERIIDVTSHSPSDSDDSYSDRRTEKSSPSETASLADTDEMEKNPKRRSRRVKKVEKNKRNASSKNSVRIAEGYAEQPLRAKFSSRKKKRKIVATMVFPQKRLLGLSIGDEDSIAEDGALDFQHFVKQIQTYDWNGNSVTDSSIPSPSLLVLSYFRPRDLRFCSLAWTAPLVLHYHQMELYQCLLMVTASDGNAQLRTGVSLEQMRPASHKESVLVFNFTAELMRRLEYWSQHSYTQKREGFDWSTICQEEFGTSVVAPDSKETHKASPLSRSPTTNKNCPLGDGTSVDTQRTEIHSSCVIPSTEVLATCWDIPLMTFIAQRGIRDDRSCLTFVPGTESLCGWFDSLKSLALFNPAVACCPNTVHSHYQHPNTSAALAEAHDSVEILSTLCVVCYQSVATVWLIESHLSGLGVKGAESSLSSLLARDQFGLRVFCVGAIQVPNCETQRADGPTGNSFNQATRSNTPLQLSRRSPYEAITSVSLSQLRKRPSKAVGVSSPGRQDSSYSECCLYLGTSAGRLFVYHLRLSDSNTFRSTLDRSKRVFHLGVLDVRLIVGGGNGAVPITCLECSPSIPHWSMLTTGTGGELNTRTDTSGSTHMPSAASWWIVAYCQEPNIGTVLMSLDAPTRRALSENMTDDECANRPPPRSYTPSLSSSSVGIVMQRTTALRHWAGESSTASQEVPLSSLRFLPHPSSSPSSPLVAASRKEVSIRDAPVITIGGLCAVDVRGCLSVFTVTVAEPPAFGLKEGEDLDIALDLEWVSDLNPRNDHLGTPFLMGSIERRLREAVKLKEDQQQDFTQKRTESNDTVERFQATNSKPKSFETRLTAAVPIVRGLGISLSWSFFLVCRQFTNFSLATVSGQLLDLQGFLQPVPNILGVVLKDLVTMRLEPLNRDLEAFSQSIMDQRWEQSSSSLSSLSSAELPLPSSSLMSPDDEMCLRIGYILSESIASRRPLQWWDLRLSLWGNQQPRPPTLVSLESIQLLAAESHSPNGLDDPTGSSAVVLRAALDPLSFWKDHVRNCEQLFSQSSSPGASEPAAALRTNDLYHRLIQRVGRLGFATAAYPSETSLSSLPSEMPMPKSFVVLPIDNTVHGTVPVHDTVPVHASLHFGLIVTFLIDHLAKLTNQPLGKEQLYLKNAPVRAALSEFISQVESCFATLSTIHQQVLSVPIEATDDNHCSRRSLLRRVIDSHVSMQLVQCVASLLAVAQPPCRPTRSSDTDVCSLWMAVMRAFVAIYRALLSDCSPMMDTWKKIQNAACIESDCPVCHTRASSSPPYKSFTCQSGHQLPGCALTFRPLFASASVAQCSVCEHYYQTNASLLPSFSKRSNLYSSLLHKILFGSSRWTCLVCSCSPHLMKP